MWAADRDRSTEILHINRSRWPVYGIAVTLAIAVVLRFVATSPLWLDEAQTVSIAHRSLPHLFSALREDGSPPLYYLLLHYWMSAFGTSSFAIRSLSGIFSVAALPLVWLVAKRFRVGELSPWPAVLILATCPFAIRYATEARMYSLMMLLVLAALLAYERVWSGGGVWAVIAAAVVTGALILTHYWAFFLVATAGLGVLIAWWRGVRRARILLVPMVLGGLLFIPWLPSFSYQSAHTGTPWGTPPNPLVPLRFLGAWATSGTTGWVLGGCYYALVVLAVIGYAGARRSVVIGGRPRRLPLLALALAVGTVAVATIVSNIQTSAYAPRYTSIVVAPVLLTVAWGFAAFPPAIRGVAIAVVCALGLWGAEALPAQLRTQAGEVATILAKAQPGDLVVFCPDQLGPAVHRLVPNAGTQVVYPTFGSPAMVDWVNYAARNESADPQSFAREALQRADGHPIWYVYNVGYPTLAGGCSSLYTSFTVARGRPNELLLPHGAFEKESVEEFPAAR